LSKGFTNKKIESFSFKLFPLTYHAPQQKDLGVKLYKIKKIMPSLLEQNYEISEFLFWLDMGRGFKGLTYPSIVLDFNSNSTGYEIAPSETKILRLYKDILSDKNQEELERAFKCDNWIKELSENQ